MASSNPFTQDVRYQWVLSLIETTDSRVWGDYFNAEVSERQFADTIVSVLDNAGIKMMAEVWVVVPVLFDVVLNAVSGHNFAYCGMLKGTTLEAQLKEMAGICHSLIEKKGISGRGRDRTISDIEWIKSELLELVKVDTTPLESDTIHFNLSLPSSTVESAMSLLPTILQGVNVTQTTRIGAQPPTPPTVNVRPPPPARNTTRIDPTSCVEQGTSPVPPRKCCITPVNHSSVPPRSSVSPQAAAPPSTPVSRRGSTSSRKSATAIWPTKTKERENTNESKEEDARSVASRYSSDSSASRADRRRLPTEEDENTNVVSRITAIETDNNPFAEVI